MPLFVAIRPSFTNLCVYRYEFNHNDTEEISMTHFKHTPKKFHVSIDDRNLKRSAAEDMDAKDRPLDEFVIEPVVDLNFDATEQIEAQEIAEENRLIDEIDSELD